MQALGIIPVKINGLSAPNVRSVNVDETIPTKTHKYSDGTRQTSEGQPDFAWSLTASLQKDAQSLMDMLEDAIASGDAMISFRLGAREYMLTGVARNGTSFSSDSDGTADLTLKGIATEMLCIS